MSKRLISETFRFKLLIMINFEKYGCNMAKIWLKVAELRLIYGEKYGKNFSAIIFLNFDAHPYIWTWEWLAILWPIYGVT